MGIDATDLFDRYEEDYEDMVGGGVPHVEINKMHISQSIEVKNAPTGISMWHFLQSVLERDTCNKHFSCQETFWR